MKERSGDVEHLSQIKWLSRKEFLSILGPNFLQNFLKVLILNKVISYFMRFSYSDLPKALYAN